MKFLLLSLTVFLFLTGCANDSHKNYWKNFPNQNLNTDTPAKTEQVNDSSDEWTIAVRDRVIFIKKQPGFENPVEKFMEAVYAQTWSRNIAGSQSEMNEVLRLIVTDKLKQSANDAIEEMIMMSDESSRNVCKTGFQSGMKILQKSEFYLLKTTCEIYVKQDISVSSIAIIFRDESNVYKLEWIIPDRSGNAMKFDDPRWEKIIRDLLPIRTCRIKSDSTKSKSGCDWFAINADDVIQRLQKNREQASKK